MSTDPIQANVNSLAENLRRIDSELRTPFRSEFEIFLAQGNIHVFILKHLLNKLGYELEQITNDGSVRRGREWQVINKKDASQMVINLEFSTSGQFEVRCNDAAKPIQNDVDYYVFMTLKYVFFVKPINVEIKDRPPTIKEKDGYKFYEYDLNRVKANSEQVIQFSSLVVF